MIIDTHVHIGNMVGFVMTREDVIVSMQNNGIDYTEVD